MSEILPVVNRLARKVYADVAREEGLLYSHPSQLGLCPTLTLAFWKALHDEGIEARRELHQTGKRGELWHMLIAYSPEPTPDEEVTDLNPWGFEEQRAHLMGDDWRNSGHLHGPRRKVNATLREKGFGGFVLALHTVEIITNPHTLELVPAEITALPPH